MGISQTPNEDLPANAVQAVNVTIKDLIEACNAMAQQAFQSWTDRRQYEWKMTMGFWAALGLGLGFFTREASIPPHWFLPTAAAGFLLYARWLHNLWMAQEFEHQIQFHYQAQARALLSGSSATVIEFPCKHGPDKDFVRTRGIRRFLLHWSMSTQIGMTLLLLVWLYLFATGGVALRQDQVLGRVEKAVLGCSDANRAILDKLAQLQSGVGALENQYNSGVRPSSGR